MGPTRNVRPDRRLLAALVIAALSVVTGFVAGSCKKGDPSAGPSSNSGLNGTWFASGCTSQPGIAGIAPPASASYTSRLVISNTSATYTVQGFTDAGCLSASNSIVTNYNIAGTGPDQAVTNAGDLTLTVTSSSVCTPSCSSNGGIGTQFLGIFLVSGNSLSINWASGTRPTTLAFTFARQ